MATDERRLDRRRTRVVEQRPSNLAAPVDVLQECLAKEKLATWPAAVHSLLLAELEGYRRITVLTRELDQHLINVARREPR